MEYVSNQDKQTYGDITERDYWNDKINAYTMKMNGNQEEYVSSAELLQNSEDDFILCLDNSSIIVKNNIPKRIQLKNN